MSKGLVGVPQSVLDTWATWQEPSSSVRLAVFDIDVDALEFRLVEFKNGTDDFKADFKLAQKFMVDGVPALIAIRGEAKWVLVAWIPEDSMVKKKLIFASSRAALKSQLGAPKFDHDFQVNVPSDCTYGNYASKFDEQEKEKTLSKVEVLTKEEAKDAFPQELQTEGMKMLNIKVNDGAIKGFSAVKNSGAAVFFYVSEGGDELTANAPISDYTVDSLAKQLDDDVPCYVIFHYNHTSKQTNQNETKIVLVYFCSDDAHPRKKMISASVVKNLAAACTALGINLAKRVEISKKSEFSHAELLDALYPPAAVREVFDKPKGPPRKSARGGKS